MSEDGTSTGYLLSGGISWLSRSYGLAMNGVVAMEVVGADGVARIVDHLREPDLFWALRRRCQDMGNKRTPAATLGR
jgi:hypothetical protein